jgi:hypothetical protein
VNHGRNSEIKSTKVAKAVIRSGCDHFFMSKANDDLLDEAPDIRGEEAATGGGVALGRCSGGYHLPSAACHQSGPFETSLTLSS